MLGLRILAAAWVHGLRVAFVLVAIVAVVGLHLAAIAAIPVGLLAFVAPQLLGPLASGLVLVAAALAIPLALGLAAQTDGARVENEADSVELLTPSARASLAPGQGPGSRLEPEAELPFANASRAAGPRRRRHGRSLAVRRRPGGPL